jgi:hypothetical protein
MEFFQEYLCLSLDKSLSLRVGVVYLTTVQYIHISVFLLDGLLEMSVVIILFLNGSLIKKIEKFHSAERLA